MTDDWAYLHGAPAEYESGYPYDEFGFAPKTGGHMTEIDEIETDETSDSPYDNNHFDPKFRTTVHVHVETSSSDCDGPLYRSSTWTPETAESSAEFFAKWMLSLHAYNGTVEVYLTSDGQWVGRFSYGTEEGHHAEEHRSCTDEYCRDQRPSQRDVYAERMGY